MKRTLKRFLCVLLVAMMALSLASCGKKEEESGELKKLSISHHPVLSGLPAYVALQKGFFEEEGLDVDMTVYISGASQMEALPSGSWSCGGAGATAGCLGTIGYGLSLLGFVGWDGPIDIFVREDSDIYQAGQGHVEGYPEIYGTAENWKGKEFLLPNGTTAHLAIFEKINDPNPDGNTLLKNIAASFRVAFSGFFMAILVGAPLGLLMGWYKPVEKFFRPLFEIIRPIPPISWIPISILFFGIGVTSKAFIIFFSAFVPTLINSNTGILSTNQAHINVGKTCGASKAKMFFTIGIPSAMPMVFAGFKLSLGNAWSTLVAAEMLASSEGLGYMIIMCRTFSRLDLLIGGMLVIGILGIFLSLAMDMIERLAVRWRYVK